MKFLGIVTVEKQPVNNIQITPSKRRVLHVWYLHNFGSNLYLRRVQQKKNNTIAAAGIQNNIDKFYLSFQRAKNLHLTWYHVLQYN